MTTDNTRHARQPRRWAALLAVILIAGPAAAETASGPDTPNDVAATPSRYELFPGFTLGGSLRIRTEDAQNFGFGTPPPPAGSDDESFGLTQLRVNLMWEWSENLTFYFEGQDSRIHRENLASDTGIPNLFEDHFDLYQGYMDWKTTLAGAPTRWRFGRQEFSFGDERLIGSNSWTNVARVFDAVRMTWGTEGQRTWDFFYSAAVPVRPGNFNDHDSTVVKPLPAGPPAAEVIPTAGQYADSEFHGIYMRDWKTFPNAEWDTYLLYRREDRVDDQVYTFGTRYDWKQGVWDWDAELAYQWGDFMDLDHEAWMLHLGLGYTAESFYNSRFGIAFNWATGDDSGLDGDHETFDNLFPTNHWQYGQMDFVSLQNTRNLELSWDTSFDKAKLRFALHAFFLDEEDSDFWYTGNLAPARPLVGPPFFPIAGGADDHIGNEFDITIRYPLMDGKVDLVAGYSHFWTEDYISNTGTSRDPHYGFLQATYQF